MKETILLFLRHDDEILLAMKKLALVLEGKRGEASYAMNNEDVIIDLKINEVAGF